MSMRARSIYLHWISYKLIDLQKKNAIQIYIWIMQNFNTVDSLIPCEHQVCIKFHFKYMFIKNISQILKTKRSTSYDKMWLNIISSHLIKNLQYIILTNNVLWNLFPNKSSRLINCLVCKNILSALKFDSTEIKMSRRRRGT